MQLSKTVIKLLKNILNMLSSTKDPVFAALTAELQQLRLRLDEPLRVAIVGLMKAGKSTLMNALLQEKILYTATLEATYTITWFKYGETPRIRVVFKDGHTQDARYDDLENWTVRPTGAEKTRLDDVAYVEIYYPNELLKTMELIDTPGLESTHGTDSQNTMDFLGQRLSKEADKLTSEAASQAEAIVYAFSRGAAGRDADVLDAFKGDAGNSSPINAIGVFTKADVYWNCAESPESDPLEIVADACDTYRKKLKDKLYTILPVVAKPVETVCELSDRAYDILKRLAAIDTPVLVDFLVDASLFSTEPEDVDMPIPPIDRRYVLDLFGQYGLYTATQAIRRGIPREGLAEHLYARSGVDRASKLILRHFGNRAYLIKLEYILRRLRTEAGRIRHLNGVSPAAIRMCERIVEDIDALRDDEQMFKELAVLQAYYNGDFSFSDPEAERQFLEITGEYGYGCEARLGFSEPNAINVLKKEALTRSALWSALANDIGSPRAVNQAADVIVRSCDSMYYHLDMLSGFD